MASSGPEGKSFLIPSCPLGAAEPLLAPVLAQSRVGKSVDRKNNAVSITATQKTFVKRLLKFCCQIYTAFLTHACASLEHASNPT